MPLKHKLLPKICEVCSETEETKFTPCVYNICKDCKKKKNSKVYLCKFCGKTEENLFYKGRYSNCKNCYNGKRCEKSEINKYIEAEDKKLDKDEITNFDIRKNIKKIIQCDINIMQGVSIKQSIEENKKEIVTNNLEIDKLREENIRIKEEISKNIAAIDDFHIYVNHLKYNYEKLINKMDLEIALLKEQNELLRCKSSLIII